MTTQRIAELEAEVARLRDALEDSGRLYCTMIGNELMTKPSMFERNVVCKFVRGRFREMRPAIIQKALSTPFTPTALNELIEKVEKRTIERCAVVCDNVEIAKERFAGLVLDDGLQTKLDCAAAIRKLGEQ